MLGRGLGQFYGERSLTLGGRLVLRLGKRLRGYSCTLRHGSLQWPVPVRVEISYRSAWASLIMVNHGLEGGGCGMEHTLICHWMIATRRVGAILKVNVLVPACRDTCWIIYSDRLLRSLWYSATPTCWRRVGRGPNNESQRISGAEIYTGVIAMVVLVNRIILLH